MCPDISLFGLNHPESDLLRLRNFDRVSTTNKVFDGFNASASLKDQHEQLMQHLLVTLYYSDTKFAADTLDI